MARTHINVPNVALRVLETCRLDGPELTESQTKLTQANDQAIRARPRGGRRRVRRCWPKWLRLRLRQIQRDLLEQRFRVTV
jgi:hypothetical protein